MRTTAIYQMFDMIAQSGVGNLGNAGLILLQLMISLFFQMKFLFLSMKNRPAMVQLSVALIPMILIASYSIVGGLFFSAFLGKGPTSQEMTALINVTLSQRCIFGMLSTVAVFFALMLIYSIAYRLNPFQWLLTFGIETFAAASLLLLYGGLLLSDFPYTILDFCEKDIYLAKWPIYGYFTLLFKCFVLVISLLLGFILRQRKEKPENEEDKYWDRQRYYEKKTLKYLTKNNVLIGGSLLLLGVAAETFCMWRILTEEGQILNRDLFFTLITISLLFLAPAAMGLFLFYRALLPKRSTAYRQLLAMGNKDTILRLFCEEIVESIAPETNLRSNSNQIQTLHFLFWQQGIRSQVKWRGERL